MATIDSASSPPAGPVSVTADSWWTLDPTDPSTARPLDVTNFETSRTAASAVHQPLGPPGQVTYPIVVSSGYAGHDGQLTIESHSAAEYQGVESLLLIESAMWLSSPYGDGIYLRYGPQPGGMSGGNGNKLRDTNLRQSPAAVPVRQTVLTFIGQPRPGV